MKLCSIGRKQTLNLHIWQECGNFKLNNRKGMERIEYMVYDNRERLSPAVSSLYRRHGKCIRELIL